MSALRPTQLLLRGLGLLLCASCAGCDGNHRLGAPELGPRDDRSGQTGSPESGGYECKLDKECEASAEAQAEQLRRPSKVARSFAGAACEQVGISAGDESRSGPACVCDTGDGGSINVGPRGGACQVRGRAGTCLWERFDGCDMSDVHSCDAVCAQLEQRYAEDAARTFDAEVAYFDCEQDACRGVISIDAMCVPISAIGSGRSYDCALGAAAILKQEGER